MIKRSARRFKQESNLAPRELVATAEDVLAARKAYGLTHVAAARLIYTSIDNWQNWEQGRYPMLPALYELFLLKTGQLLLPEIVVVGKSTARRFPQRTGTQ